MVRLGWQLWEHEEAGRMAGKILFLVLRCRLRVKFPIGKTTAKAISSLGRLGALWICGWSRSQC